MRDASPRIPCGKQALDQTHFLSRNERMDSNGSDSPIIVLVKRPSLSEDEKGVVCRIPCGRIAGVPSLFSSEGEPVADSREMESLLREACSGSRDAIGP